MYASRAQIPSNKKNKFIKSWRQVLAYAFPKQALKILLDGKSGTAEDFASGLSELQSDTIGDLGEDRAGTRNKFGNHVFPTSIDPGQDVLKFNMMKYVPKKFDQKT